MSSTPTLGPSNWRPTRGPIRGPTTTQDMNFPWKLHILLEETSKGSDPSILFLPGDRAFKVHKKDVFCKEHMPILSKSSKYKAFRHHLNPWGFTLIPRGPDRGAYFVLGKLNLCEEVKFVERISVSATSKKLSGPTSKTIPTPWVNSRAALALLLDRLLPLDLTPLMISSDEDDDTDGAVSYLMAVF
jgi:hypothetical protein